MLSQLDKEELNIEVGLNCDDGLSVSSSTPRQIDKIKDKISEIFRKNGLRVTIEANKKVVTFLDVEFDLNENTYRPFIKPNDRPLYIHKQSNHPNCITKNIPIGVNKRLSKLSSNQNMFESVAPIYQEALVQSGYDFKLARI